MRAYRFSNSKPFRVRELEQTPASTLAAYRVLPYAFEERKISAAVTKNQRAAKRMHIIHEIPIGQEDFLWLPILSMLVHLVTLLTNSHDSRSTILDILLRITKKS